METKIIKTFEVRILAAIEGVNDGDIYATFYAKDSVVSIGEDLFSTFVKMGVVELVDAGEGEQVEPVEDEGELSAHTVAELLEIAAELGVEYDKTPKKATIIADIIAARAAVDAGEGEQGGGE